MMCINCNLLQLQLVCKGRAVSCAISRGQQSCKASVNSPHRLGFQRVLPGGDGVTCVNEVGEGMGESWPPFCRGQKVDLSGRLKVQQAVSEDTRGLQVKGNKKGKKGGQSLESSYQCGEHLTTASAGNHQNH